MTDRSNGYEDIAEEFLAGRGGPQSAGIGVEAVRAWSRQLRPGASIIDLGCGSGLPITQILVAQGLDVYALDASPTLVRAFEVNHPGVPVRCEAVEDSSWFERSFDAVLSWGLIFLLQPEDQRRLLRMMAERLEEDGRLLFTAPRKATRWKDAMTNRDSSSLGAESYWEILNQLGVVAVAAYEDSGGNYYFDGRKTRNVRT